MKLPSFWCSASSDSTRWRKAASPAQASSRKAARSARVAMFSAAVKISRSVIAQPFGLGPHIVRNPAADSARKTGRPRKNSFRCYFLVEPRPGEGPNALGGPNGDSQDLGHFTHVQ